MVFALSLNLPERNKPEFLQSIYTYLFLFSSSLPWTLYAESWQTTGSSRKAPNFQLLPSLPLSWDFLSLHHPAKRQYLLEIQCKCLLTSMTFLNFWPEPCLSYVMLQLSLSRFCHSRQTVPQPLLIVDRAPWVETTQPLGAPQPCVPFASILHCFTI